MIWIGFVLSAIQLAVFLAIGSQSQDMWATLTENFGSISTALATTWYVIFTYGILVSTHQHASIASEPKANMGWMRRENCDHYIEDEELSEGLIAKIGAMGISDVSKHAEEQEWWALRVVNARKVDLLNITVAFEIKILLDGTLQKVFQTEWKSDDNFELKYGSVVWVGLLDLATIPRNLEISIEVTSLMITGNQTDQIFEEQFDRLGEIPSITLGTQDKLNQQHEGPFRDE